MPPGAKRGGRGNPPLPPGKRGGKNGARAAKGAPLVSPPPRKRTTAGMPLPVANPTPVMRTPAIAVHIMPPGEERAEAPPGRLGPAMSAAAGSNPKRRALAQAMRGGRVPM